MMSKRLPAALTAAALCSLFGALHAQTSDAPDATGQERYQVPMPASDPAPSPVVPIHRELIPQSRSDVQAETLAAMRSRQIPHGELSTPEQDKGSERALAPFERGMAPSAY